MKKIILVGRSECGKTTLTQALKGEKIHYHKTQYVNRFDVIIDTPGEYIQTKNLGNAIAMYTFEADVVGLLMSSREPYSLYPPCVTPLCNRPVIGIVTQINSDGADPDRAESWLRLAGCETICVRTAMYCRGTKKKKQADRRKCLSVFSCTKFCNLHMI